MKINLNVLDTEMINENTKNIDQIDTISMLHAINEEDKKVAPVVEEQIPTIAKLVDEIQVRMQKGGRVVYIGAGTSGRLGVLDASECPPTYGVDASLIQGIMAGGFEALLKAKEGAEDSKELCVEDLKNIQLNENDTVIGLAASGRTPYVIGGLEYANSISALTGSISCVHDSEISKYAKYGIEAVTGPEAITGSTRMKAGTAQKLILNMISTSLMVHYGKVYSNLMVDVQPTNEKLVVRATRIISLAGECTIDEASDYLEKSEHNVKLAICMAVSKQDKDSCVKILNDSNGNVSKALHKLKA